ncbi:MAG: hypothetical protein M3304_04015 [Actinomycetota bacterium]|nr:hypothetical protein [Actinomycetota bacterium]
MGRERDRLLARVLLDDREARRLVDDPLDLRLLVPGHDRELDVAFADGVMPEPVPDAHAYTRRREGVASPRLARYR